MRLYKEGDILEENEFLLKLESIEGKDLVRPRKVFLSKPTQKGEIPKSMIKWGNGREIIDETKPRDYNNLRTIYPKIYIHEEKFREGWKVYGFRRGASQDWVVLINPEGYSIEIYARHFYKKISYITISEGNILGEYLWMDYNLYKKNGF